MTKVGDISRFLDEKIPLSYQEEYDNSGLQVGSTDAEISSALLALDVTIEILEQAIELGSGLVITHHPLLFGGLKKVRGDTLTERIIIKAIQNNISIYSAHTNLDVIPGGVSYRLAEKIGISNLKPLIPLASKLSKIVVYAPLDHAEKIREAMFSAGAGNIGNYDHCSFNTEGTGTFRAGDGTKPYSGNIGTDSAENEVRIETVAPNHLVNRVVSAMIKIHPYEEVAYDIFRLENSYPGGGLGVIGELDKALADSDFLSALFDKIDLSGLRYSNLSGKMIRKVAVCGGSGASFIPVALNRGADAYLTGDIKYHAFFDTGEMLLADIGHYESEKYSLEILYEIITKKFPKFAIRISEVNTNPVNYLPAWKKQK